jgi:hypothetical protein
VELQLVLISYKLTSGWQPSDLIIIAARPAMGKTAFVIINGKKYGY